MVFGTSAALVQGDAQSASLAKVRALKANCPPTALVTPAHLYKRTRASRPLIPPATCVGMLVRPRSWIGFFPGSTPGTQNERQRLPHPGGLPKPKVNRSKSGVKQEYTL